MSELRCIWDLQATLGESPIWRAREHALWFVDIKQNRIHRFDTELHAGRSWSTPSQPGFLAPLDAHSFVVGLQTGLHRFDARSGELRLLRDVEPARPTNRLNDCHVDDRGSLWFGSMDDGEREKTGALYRLDPSGDLTCLEADICITNGPCISPDGRTFYHTDTVGRTI